MASGIRKDEKAKKIFYKIIKVPKEMQQGTQKRPSMKLRRQWFIDSLMSM